MKELKLITFVLLILCAESCRRESDIEDEVSEKRIVIEGNITNGKDAAVIKISKSGGIKQTSGFEKINSAIVSVEVDGTSYNISNFGNGEYSSDEFVPVVGKQYNLTVKVEGKKYTASTIFPEPIGTTLVSSTPIMYSTNYRAQKIALEFAEGNSYYRIKNRVNEQELKGYPYSVDYYKSKMAGDTIHYITWAEKENPFIVGDSIATHICSVDKVTADYFESLAEAADQGILDYNPFNPKNNFNETNIYGYFGSCNESVVKWYFQ